MIAVTAEPKMEDLLASIRRAIHDDIGDMPSSAAVQAQGMLFKGSMRELRVKAADDAPLTDSVKSRRLSGRSLPGDDFRPSLAEPEPRRFAAVSRPTIPATGFWDDEDSSPAGSGILSPEAEATTGTAFNNLARSLFERPDGGPPMEAMTRELLRGLLKQWLNANLPSLVERLVREEIERVARRGR